MKLTIKTLKGEVFSVQADPANTIQDVKAKVKEAKGFEVEAQKLVFKGKNTNNTDTLETLGVKEADFMVVMVAQKKAEEKPVEKKEEKAPEKVEEKPAQEKKAEKPPASGGMGLISNQQYEAALEQIIAMGFDRETAVAAMRAAYNNPDRAVEYCINGIPQKPAQAPQPQPAATNAQSVPAQGAEGALDPSLLLGLVSSPQFAQIRQIVRSNPAALPQLLQQIAQSSPQVFQLISQNPELFEQLLLSDDLPPMQPPPGTIQVTNQQKEAIERLAALGFPKIEAAQAYIACDKNEQLAANLLFDRQANGDFDPEPEQQNKGGSQGGNQGGNKDKDKNNDDDNDNLFS